MYNVIEKINPEIKNAIQSTLESAILSLTPDERVELLKYMKDKNYIQ